MFRQGLIYLFVINTNMIVFFLFLIGLKRLNFCSSARTDLGEKPGLETTTSGQRKGSLTKMTRKTKDQTRSVKKIMISPQYFVFFS